MKKITAAVIALLFVFSLLASSGCSSKEQKRFQAESILFFDTVTTIVGYAKDTESFTAIANEAKELIEEYHKLYDIYNSYEGINNLKTINDNAGIEPVKVDRRIIDMLTFAREMYNATGGMVNVAMGSVLRVWHDYREQGIENPESAAIPPMEVLLSAAEHTDIDDMIIDTEAGTVFLRDPKMRLDVGAIAKGYAVEQVMRHFEEKDVDSLLISIGGNVRAIGGKPGKAGKTENWSIGIKNPDTESEQNELFLLDINGLSVISSGTYERYYIVDGRRYHHIIDPVTLMPKDTFLQVSIICRDSGLGDALSTAVFNMSLEEGIDLIDSMENVEAAWVLDDGSIVFSEGFQDYIKKRA